MTANEAEARRLISTMTVEELLLLQLALFDNKDQPEFASLRGQKVWENISAILTDILLEKLAE